MLTSVWLHSVAGLVTITYGYKVLRALGWRKGIVMALTREMMVKGKGNTFVTMMLPIVGAIELALGTITQSICAIAIGTADKRAAKKVEEMKIATAIERASKLTPASQATTVRVKPRPVGKSTEEALFDMIVELEVQMWKNHDNLSRLLHPSNLRKAEAVTETFNGPVSFSKPHDVKRKEDNRARREVRDEVRAMKESDWKRLAG